MLKSYRILFCAAFLSLLSLYSLTADDAVTLRYKPEKKNPQIYRTVTTIKQKQTVANMNFDSRITTSMVTLWNLTETNDQGRFHWQTENKLLEVEAEIGPLGKFKFDSRSNERDGTSALGAALTPIYDSLNGAFLNVTLDPRGRVTEVKGYADLIKDKIKGDPFSGQYTFGGTDQGALLGMQEQLVILSKDAVKKGDSWDAVYDMTVPNIGKITGKKTFTHDGTEKFGDREAVKIGISYVATIDSDYRFEGGKATGTLTTNASSGTAHFDPKSGQLLSLKSSVTFTGNVTLEIGGNTFDVPTEQTLKIEVELLDKLPEQKSR